MSSQQHAAAQTAPSVYNVANLLTMLRLLLVPVFVLCVGFSGGLEHVGWSFAACAVFLGASATDFVDGWLARRNGLVTSFGKLADPIADKALIGSALVLFSLWGLLMWWVTILVLARELGVTALRVWVIRHGVMPASRGGKVKTVLQITAIAWYLFPWPAPFDAVGPWLMAAAVIVTVATGLDYVVRALALRRRARERA